MRLPSERACVAQADCRCRLWPLLITPQTYQPFRSKRIASNSFAWKILPITLTGSRFCRAFPNRNDCFQDFAGGWGEKGILRIALQMVHPCQDGAWGKRLPICKHAGQKNDGRKIVSGPPNPRLYPHKQGARHGTSKELAAMLLLAPVLYQGLTSVGPTMHQYARALAPAIIPGPEGRVWFSAPTARLKPCPDT